MYPEGKLRRQLVHAARFCLVWHHVVRKQSTPEASRNAAHVLM